MEDCICQSTEWMFRIGSWQSLYSKKQGCGAMIPLHTCPVVEMPKELSKAGFTVTEHHLEIAGICRNCKDKNK